MITLSELKAYLGISWSDQDNLLGLFVNSANWKVKSILWYNPTAQTYTNIKINGNGQNTFITKERPLNSVTSLQYKEDVTFNNVTDPYLFNSNWVINLEFLLYKWFANYQITYNAWYASDSVELAHINMIALQYASMLYSTRWSNGVKRESVSGDSIEFVDTFDFSWLDYFRDVY